MAALLELILRAVHCRFRLFRQPGRLFGISVHVLQGGGKLLHGTGLLRGPLGQGHAGGGHLGGAAGHPGRGRRYASQGLVQFLGDGPQVVLERLKVPGILGAAAVPGQIAVCDAAQHRADLLQDDPESLYHVGSGIRQHSGLVPAFPLRDGAL